MKKSKWRLSMFTLIVFVLAAFATSNVYALTCSSIKKELDWKKLDPANNKVGLIMITYGLRWSGYSSSLKAKIPSVRYLDIPDLNTAYSKVGWFPVKIGLRGTGDLLFNDREFLHPSECRSCSSDSHPFTPHGPDPVAVKLNYKTSTLTLDHNGKKIVVDLVCNATNVMVGSDIKAKLSLGGIKFSGSGRYILSLYRWDPSELLPN